MNDVLYIIRFFDSYVQEKQYIPDLSLGAKRTDDLTGFKVQGGFEYEK